MEVVNMVMTHLLLLLLFFLLYQLLLGLLNALLNFRSHCLQCLSSSNTKMSKSYRHHKESAFSVPDIFVFFKLIGFCDGFFQQLVDGKIGRHLEGKIGFRTSKEDNNEAFNRDKNTTGSTQAYFNVQSKYTCIYM